MSTTIQISQGDWVMANGELQTVADAVKLLQDIDEALSIDTQPNGYGAGLDALLGMDTTLAVFRMLVQQNIQTSIQALIQIQQSTLFGQRPLTEQIDSISRLVVQPANLGGGQAQTAYAFQLRVAPKAGATISRTGLLTP